MLKAIGIGGLALLMFVGAARGQGGAVPRLVPSGSG